MLESRELRIGVLACVVAASSGCRSRRAEPIATAHPPDASVSADAGPRDASTPEAGAASTWPALDGEQHCASLRTIAGYIGVVPAWRSDAGYLQTFNPDAGAFALLTFGDDIVWESEIDRDEGVARARGKQVPSGFASCERVSSLGASNNWGAGYECVVGPAPSEEAASSRLRELTLVWRRCLASSGLKQERDELAGRFGFFQPRPPGKHAACSVERKGLMLSMGCGVGENN
jgi:hypothetical protein